MKICIASDLHDDIGDPRPIDWPEADVLVLAGDTGNSPAALIDVLRTLVARYDHIVVVDGNHEHYTNALLQVPVSRVLNYLGNELTGNVTFLPTSGVIKIGELHFVGRNGWYSFDYAGDPINNRAVWKQKLNDNQYVGFDEIEQTQPWERAVEDAQHIRDAIEQVIATETDARFVVVTHTAPHRDMVSTDSQFLATNAFFVNQHMAQTITDYAPNIALWCHGHTHHRRDRLIDGVYVVANPRGYPGENPSWEPVVIDV